MLTLVTILALAAPDGSVRNLPREPFEKIVAAFKGDPGGLTRQKAGGLSRRNGDRFRAKLLARGGSVDAMEIFRDFRGRDIKPLLAAPRPEHPVTLSEAAQRLAPASTFTTKDSESVSFFTGR